MLNQESNRLLSKVDPIFSAQKQNVYKHQYLLKFRYQYACDGIVLRTAVREIGNTSKSVSLLYTLCAYVQHKVYSELTDWKLIR